MFSMLTGAPGKTTILRTEWIYSANKPTVVYFRQTVVECREYVRHAVSPH